MDRNRKDIKEQREQLFRKLEVLRKYQGIELGPNMAILKSDPTVGFVTQQPGEVKFLHPDSNASDASDRTSYRSPTSSGLTTPSVGVRKTSSMSGGSSNSNLLQGNNTIATGGSLKKESFTNQHLMSATNETKQSVVGLEKHEIKQQIPVKLSSKFSVSTKTSATSSSTGALATLGNVAPNPSVSEKMAKKSLGSNLSSASSLNMSNTASALPKPDTVQQLLPFKLSEASYQQQNYPQQISPGKHRHFNPNPYVDAASVRMTQPSANLVTGPYAHPQPVFQDMQSVPRVGAAQPHPPTRDSPTLPQQLQKSHSNTLPKKGHSGEKSATSEGGGDDVIYFF